MFCPQCGKPGLSRLQAHEYRCACGFHYFQNVASAVAVMLLYQDQLLVARRGRDPGKGLLDFPGGFVDPAEDLEMALRREMQEELALDVSDWPREYLGSASNLYHYDGLDYYTCDSYFLFRLTSQPVFQVGDDVVDGQWLPLAQIRPQDFAFDSSRQGLQMLHRRLAEE